MFGWAGRARLRLLSSRVGKRGSTRATKGRGIRVNEVVRQGEMVVRRLPVREPAGLPWQAAFEALPAPVLMLGPDGALLARNAPARTLLGALAEPGAHCCELLGCRVPGSGL